MVEAGARGEIDVLYSSGGNFLDVLPDPDFVRSALERVPVRVHQDIVVSSQMLVDPGEVVVLLAGVHPVRATRRRHRDDDRAAHRVQPRGPGSAHRGGAQRVGDLRRPRAPGPSRPRGPARLRGRATRSATRSPGSSRPTPASSSSGSSGTRCSGAGPRLCADGEFPTPDGKAQFSPVRSGIARAARTGAFVLSTRRGKQFNSMVYAGVDPLTGAPRDALLLAAEDAEALKLADGAPVLVRSEHGELKARVHLAPIRPGNVQVFFPEGNVLLPHGMRDPALRRPRLQRRGRDRPR